MLFYIYNMKQKYKKLVIIIVCLLLVTLILTLVANVVLENKIKTVINKLPQSVDLGYSEIDVNVWGGDFDLIQPDITITGETTKKPILNAKLKSLKIENIGYWDYLVNDIISIKAIELDEPIAKYNHNSKVKNSDYKKAILKEIKAHLKIDNIIINKADILISKYENDSVILSIPELNFKLNNLVINTKNSQNEREINYDEFVLDGKHLEWAINNYEDLFLDAFNITDSSSSLQKLRLQTKYERAELSAMLTSERDHFKVSIDEVLVDNIDLGYRANNLFYFSSDRVKLSHPEAEIYRDKLVADDVEPKQLYSALLRELDFDLSLKTVEISDGKISYLEKTKISENAGRLDFKAFNATVTNLGNTFGNEDTKIKVNTLFMENSPLEVDWSFKVTDTSDHFLFKAKLGYLDATQMDQYTKPNLNVDLNGELKQTYFTIDANPLISRIDLKVKYDNFKISILKENGKEKNKFLSGLINLFVSEDSEEDKKNFRYGQDDTVERDVSKSVFNYTWLNVKAGLLSAMAGDGEKED